MYKLMIILALIIFTQQIHCFKRYSPEIDRTLSQFGSACVCDTISGRGVSIQCGGDMNIDLKSMFASLRVNPYLDSKNLFRFYLNNTGIQEIPHDVFSDITFEEIVIYKAYALTRIDAHAFTSTRFYTNFFELSNTPVDNILDALNSMSKLKSIIISNTSLTSVPKLAKLSNLLEIRIVDNSRLESIAHEAFNLQPNIQLIELYNNRIKRIGSQAFPNLPDANLLIDLKHNELDLVDSLKRSSLDAFNVVYGSEIDLGYNYNLSPISSYGNFILRLIERENQIWFTGIRLVCDCGARWLYQNEKYAFSVKDAVCDDGYALFNETRAWFQNC